MSWLRWTALTILVVALTFALHETAHGLAGAALGYDTFISINSSGLTNGGEYRSGWDQDVVSLAGPVATLAQAVLGYLFASRLGRGPALIIVSSALMMRILAAVASTQTPNDEARLGFSWGVGFWTVHALVIAALLVLVVLTIRATRPSIARIALVLVVICASMVGVVIAEPYLPTLYI